MSTAITVVTCMIRIALPLDSSMPRMFWRQKYAVTAMAKKAAVKSGGSMMLECASLSSSLIRPTRYWPADTPLIGPVRM